MRLAALLLPALLLATVAHAATDHPRNNPGLQLYLDATKHYQAGDYTAAYQTFRQSARWGNKLSQFNIGTMYYNGIGVSRDAAHAWAWIELSAERDYPQLVDAAAEIWRELDQGGRDRATRILTDLQSEYADPVALPRIQRHVNRRYRSATGSRLGGGAPSNPLLVQPRDDHHTIGDVFYDPRAWSVERWLEKEAAWFRQMMETGEPVAEFEEID